MPSGVEPKETAVPSKTTVPVDALDRSVCLAAAHTNGASTKQAIKVTDAPGQSSVNEAKALVESVVLRSLREAWAGIGGSLFSTLCTYVQLRCFALLIIWFQPIDLVKTRMQIPNAPYTGTFPGYATGS